MFEADIYVEDGHIKLIGKDIFIQCGAEIIDAKEKLIIPGGIDTDTHFQLPFIGTSIEDFNSFINAPLAGATSSIDDFHSGTKAALAGGTTMIIDCCFNRGTTLFNSFSQWRLHADENVCCDYSLHAAVTSWDMRVKSDMEILTKQMGVNSFQVFMAYGNFRMTDSVLLSVLEQCAKLGALAQVHAENGDIITMNQQKVLSMGITGPEGHLYSSPEDVEADATNRAIVLANSVKCPLYVLHVMSKSAGDIIAKMRQEGYLVYGEAIAAALGVDGSHYFNNSWPHAAAFVMSPPLRPNPETPRHLMNLLSSGVLQATGSDNCTFHSSQKEIGMMDFTKIPNGVNGVEDRMSVIWERGVMTGILDPCRFVAITSTNAAKIFNIYPRKGRIEVGSDADIVVWDPHASRVISSKTHHQNANFNIFEGMKVRGVPEYVISRGKIVVEKNNINVTQGAGQFIPTEPYSPFVYARLQQQEMRPPPVHREIDISSADIPSTSSSVVSFPSNN